MNVFRKCAYKKMMRIIVVHYPSSWLCGTWTDADPCPSTAQYTYSWCSGSLGLNGTWSPR